MYSTFALKKLLHAKIMLFILVKFNLGLKNYDMQLFQKKNTNLKKLSKIPG